MASIYTKKTTVIPDLIVSVFVNGTKRPDFYCTGVHSGSGIEGSTADLELISFNWDARAKFLGNRITVTAKYRGAGTGKTLFSGYISSINRDAGSQSITATAKSIIAFSKDIFIGQRFQSKNSLEVRYPKVALFNGFKYLTGWSIQSIIRNFFSGVDMTWRGGGGGIPASWQQYLKAGDMSVFDSIYNTVPIDNMDFKGRSLMDALEDLLQLVSTVSFKERFDGDVTFLDFYEIGSPLSPKKSIKIARNAAESIKDKNVFTLSKSESSEDIKDRIIAVGNQKKFVVTLSSNQETGIPLVRDWNQSYESDVLKNPEGVVTPGISVWDQSKKEYWEARNKVFRRYRIPDFIVRNFTIDDQNAITEEFQASDGAGTDESNVPVQIFKQSRRINFTGPPENEFSSEAISAFELIDNANFDPKTGIIEFTTPQVFMVAAYLDANNKPVEIYEEETIYITFTYNNGRLIYDTGKINTGEEMVGVAADGRTDYIEATGFGYIELGNTSTPIGYPPQFVPAVVFQKSNGEWNSGFAQVIQDDTFALEYFANISLQEKSAKVQDYSIETPFLSWAFEIGDVIGIRGEQSFERTTHQVQTVDYNLTADHSTSINTNTATPMMASTILSQNVGGA